MAIDSADPATVRISWTSSRTAAAVGWVVVTAPQALLMCRVTSRGWKAVWGNSKG
jgi:hypothetical protein